MAVGFVDQPHDPVGKSNRQRQDKQQQHIDQEIGPRHLVVGSKDRQKMQDAGHTAGHGDAQHLIDAGIAPKALIQTKQCKNCQRHNGIKYH